MKFICPSCSAPFDSMGLPVTEVKCPNCGTCFTPGVIAQGEEDPLELRISEWVHVRRRLQETDEILIAALGDLYALGIWLISMGKELAGVKACDMALCAIPGMSDELYRWLLRGARQSPDKFVKLMRPHAEILDLFLES